MIASAPGRSSSSRSTRKDREPPPAPTVPRHATRRSWTMTTRHEPRRAPRTSKRSSIAPSFALMRSSELAPPPQLPDVADLVAAAPPRRRRHRRVPATTRAARAAGRRGARRRSWACGACPWSVKPPGRRRNGTSVAVSARGVRRSRGARPTAPPASGPSRRARGRSLVRCVLTVFSLISSRRAMILFGSPSTSSARTSRLARREQPPDRARTRPWRIVRAARGSTGDSPLAAARMPVGDLVRRGGP